MIIPAARINGPKDQSAPASYSVFAPYGPAERALAADANEHGRLAQSVERGVHIAGVTGSSPVAPTTPKI